MYMTCYYHAVYLEIGLQSPPQIQFGVFFGVSRNFTVPLRNIPVTKYLVEDISRQSKADYISMSKTDY